MNDKDFGSFEAFLGIANGIVASLILLSLIYGIYKLVRWFFGV